MPPLLRLAVLPFVLSYTVATTRLLRRAVARGHALIATPALVFLHIVAFLACQWSLSARCALQLRRVRRDRRLDARARGGRVGQGADLRAAPRGRRRRALRVPEAGVHLRRGRRRRRHAGAGRRVRARLRPPTRETFGHYAAARGYRDDAALAAARRQRGPNECEIPRVSFGAMLMEHALAPFFVFQVLCVLLWSLDDYWYYSLFTLVMLVVFECTVVNSRLRHADEMRPYSAPPSPCHAFRRGRWEALSSADLLPGDLLALERAPPINGAARRLAVSRRRPPPPRLGGGERVDADR